MVVTVHGFESTRALESVNLQHLSMVSRDDIIAELKQLVEKQAKQIFGNKRRWG